MAFRNITYLYGLRTTTAARSTSGMIQDFVLTVAGVKSSAEVEQSHHPGVVVLNVALLLLELPATLQCHFSIFSSQSLLAFWRRNYFFNFSTFCI